MTKKIDLEKDSISSLFIKFAIPSIISMLVISLYTIIDGIFIARGVGSSAMAAVNIGYPVLTLGTSVSFMLGIGGATLIAFKKGDIKYQNKCFTHIIFLNLIIYLLIAILVFGFTNPLIYFLGGNDEILPLIRGYLYPCTTAAFFLMLSSSLNAVVRNDGNPRKAMTSTILGAICNIILDYIFIFKFNMGIEGGATATAISQIISALYLFTHFINSTFKIELNKKLDFHLISSIILIGFPSFMLEFSVGVISVLLNIEFMRIGGVFAAAAYSIVAYAFMFYRMLFLGLAQAGQPIISYNYGKQKLEKIKESFKVAHKLTFIISVISLISVFAFSESIISIFTEDPEMLAACTRGFILYSIAISFLGFNCINIAYLQAINQPLISVIISISRSFGFGFIAFMVFPDFLSLDGVWLNLPFADFATSLASVPFIKKFLVIKKYKLS
ncbi:MATE family efflux transporter [Fusobacterium sp. MFO224]|uniref:MATE family efflux transporter n=1 Tax=Fusobacterium sp. MFO224 TaxID=3378070 RepID=UPI003851D18B